MIRRHPNAIDLDDVLLAFRQQAVVSNPFHAIPELVGAAYGFDRPPPVVG